MQKPFFLILALILFISCEEDQIKIQENIQVEIGVAKKGILDELSNNIKYINLNFPEDIFIGAISHIKHYGNYLFLHDQFQTKSITVIDTLGNFITQLKRIGRGPGEYVNIDAFSFDHQKKELIIYDRTTSTYNFYSFPELMYIRSIKKNRYIMNFEVLDSNHWFVISDDRGAEIWNGDLRVISSASLIGNDPSSVDISYPNTISRIAGEVYYSYSNEHTTVFKIDIEEHMPIITIDFRENKIPSEYWKMNDAYKFEESLTKGNLKATWVQNFVMNEKRIAFWFLYKDINTRYFTIYDRRSKKSQVFSELRIEGTNIKLSSPKGVLNNSYITTIYPEYIDSVATLDNKRLLKSLSNNNGKLTPILVIYNLKNHFDSFKSNI